MMTHSALLRRNCRCGCCSNKLDEPLRKTKVATMHDVLRAQGRALDPSARRAMEARFGHDFSSVRVHDDAAAGSSARSLGSNAYTVGRDIVFGPGTYRPGTQDGDRLLAHELTHTIQQRSVSDSLPDSLEVSRPSDTVEGDANSAAETLAAPKGISTTQSARASIMRDEDISGVPDADAGCGSGNDRSLRSPDNANQGDSTVSGDASAAQTDAGAQTTDAGTQAADAGTQAQQPICGPNVTSRVSDVVSNVESNFASWGVLGKSAACAALSNVVTGGFAWDIDELHNIADYKSAFQPPCATPGQHPACSASVQIDNDCHYAGSVNYVVFGKMCSLCDAFLPWPGFSEDLMLNLIWAYKKVWPSVAFDPPAANYAKAIEWARAGYHGWPGASSPTGDRSNCSPTCTTPYGYSNFHVRWVPHGWF